MQKTFCDKCDKLLPEGHKNTRFLVQDGEVKELDIRVSCSSDSESGIMGFLHGGGELDVCPECLVSIINVKHINQKS